MKNTEKESAKEPAKRKIENYSEYSFGPDDLLEVNPQVLDMVRQFVNEVLGTDGTGVFRVTRPRYSFLNKETGVEAKAGTKKENLDKNFTRTYDHVKTMQSQPEEFILPIGKKALALIEVLNFVHKENLDAGRGDTVKNIQAKQVALQEKQQKDAEERAAQEVGPQDIPDLITEVPEEERPKNVRANEKADAPPIKLVHKKEKTDKKASAKT